MDPICEKYYGVSPYAYCFNNPVRFIDSDGKAPGDFFFTIIAAAKDFGSFYNDNSIREDREYGSTIYKVRNSKGKWGYSYTVANRGGEHDVSVSYPPLNFKVVADIHTHGAWSNDEFYDNEFSGIRKNTKDIIPSRQRKNIRVKDLKDPNTFNFLSFLATPNGSLQMYDSQTGKISVISNDLPSDNRDPDRMNEKSSYFERNPMSFMDELYRMFYNKLSNH